MAMTIRNNKRIKQKVLLLLSLPMTITLCVKCNTNQGSNSNGVLNIIPNGYIGRVVIIYKQKNGSEQNIIDGKRIYEIPNCGFLKTKFERPAGLLKIPEADYFTYIYANGDTIPYLSNTSQLDSSRLNEVFSFSQGIGGFSFDDEIEYEASEYIIDTLKNIGNYDPFRIKKEDFEKCK